MKKAVALILALLMVAGLCACTVNVRTPEGTVDEFFKALEDKDAEVLALYIDNFDVNALINNTVDEEVMDGIYKDLMKNLSWEITSVEMNDDQTEAVVTVEVTNVDFSKVIDNYKSEAVTYMKDNLYDEEVTKEVMTDESMRIFAETVSAAASEKDNTVTKTVEVKLVKNDTYTWDMEVTKDLTKAALGGMLWPTAD